MSATTKSKEEVLSNPEDPFNSEIIGYPDNSEQIKYVDAAEKAKTCKQELNNRFPKTSFYRSTDKYAGGSSFRISWENGPSNEKVKEIVNKYQHNGEQHNPQADLHQVDNYAFTDRSVDSDLKAKVKGWLSDLGVTDRLHAVLDKTSFEDGKAVECTHRFFKAEDGKLVLS